jgi:hypothetical protein
MFSVFCCYIGYVYDFFSFVPYVPFCCFMLPLQCSYVMTFFAINGYALKSLFHSDDMI